MKAYIGKERSFHEKGEEIVCAVKTGEIRSNAGNWSVLRTIKALLTEDKTLEEIFAAEFICNGLRNAVISVRMRLASPKTPAVLAVVGRSPTWFKRLESYCN